MKKIISFTASMEIETEEDYEPQSFEEAEDCGYDNIGRPLDYLKGAGWVIKNKKIKVC